MNEELQEEQDLLFMLEKKYKNDWYYFCYEQPNNEDSRTVAYILYNTVYANHWYAPAERLIKKGKLDVQYFDFQWKVPDIKKDKLKNTKFISAIKLKENIKK